MNVFGITVVGHDRPGIVADVTGALAQHSGNIEDSSMTLLRGHFAWTLVVALPVDRATVEATVAPLRRDDLLIGVLDLPHDAAPSAPPTHWLTVHGADRPGIVAAVARTVADFGGNITDLSTRLGGDLYVVAADVTLPGEANESALVVALDENANELGVAVSLRRADIDEGF